MAIIYHSALVNRIKGRLGTVVYYLRHGDSMTRLFPTTFSHPITSRTIQIKANFTELTKLWDGLSNEKKRLWQSRAIKSGKCRHGQTEFMSLNSTLLHASHADLTMISYPPLRPGTPRFVRNLCFFQVSTYSMCLFWYKPLTASDYVQAYFRLHRNFCSQNPSFGLCTSVGYRPCFRFIETVRSDVGFIEHLFDWPPGTRLFYKATSLDIGGRKSPFTNEQETITEILDYFYVCDYNNHRIIKRRLSDLSYVSHIHTNIVVDSACTYPRGICVDHTYLYFSDSNHGRVIKLLKNDLSYVSESEGTPPPENRYTALYGIHCDETYLFLCDTDNHRIFKLSSNDLSFVSKIGSLGTGNDNFNLPYNLAIDYEFVFVCDTINCRIVKRLKSNLSYVSQFGSHGHTGSLLYNPQGAAVDFTFLYVADTLNHRVIKFLKSDFSYVCEIGSLGSGLNQFNEPDSIAVDTSFLYVCDRKNSRLVKLQKSDLSWISTCGSLGTGDDNFDNIRGIDLDSMTYQIFFKK